MDVIVDERSPRESLGWDVWLLAALARSAAANGGQGGEDGALRKESSWRLFPYGCGLFRVGFGAQASPWPAAGRFSCALCETTAACDDTSAAEGIDWQGFRARDVAIGFTSNRGVDLTVLWLRSGSALILRHSAVGHRVLQISLWTFTPLPEHVIYHLFYSVACARPPAVSTRSSSLCQHRPGSSIRRICTDTLPSPLHLSSGRPEIALYRLTSP